MGTMNRSGTYSKHAGKLWKVKCDHHDVVVKKVCGRLETVYGVHEEPKIPTPAGLRKPDIR